MDSSQGAPAKISSPEEESAPSSPEDSALVEAMIAGDSGALALLYDRYAPLLLALARRVLHDASDAEEVLQEVFLQAWNQAARYRGSRSSVSTWLVMLTRSRSIDRLRSRQSRERTLTAFKEESPRDRTSARAVGNVLMKERRERLQRELAVLPEEQRAVLELAFYQGMSQSEIAGFADLPLGTVKTRTLLAMRKLRRALGAEMRELL